MTSGEQRIPLAAASAFYLRREKVPGIDEQSVRPPANATEQ